MSTEEKTKLLREIARLIAAAAMLISSVAALIKVL